MSPFQALYGRPPPNIFQTYSRPSHNPSVAELLEERESTLKLLKDRIAWAQTSMATFANRHRKDVEFQVGNKVLLSLQPYRQTSVSKPASTKLGKRFYGPYEITERIGKVAYRLRLPVDSKIHDVFHVSLLRPFVQSKDTTVDLPDEFRRSQPLDVPVRASARRVVLVDKIPQEQWLVDWSSAKSTSPSWEPTSVLKAHFPHLHLEDKAVSLGEGVDTEPTRQAQAEAAQAQFSVVPGRMIDESGSRAHSAEEEPSQPNKVAKPNQPKSTRRKNPTRTKSRPSKYKDYVSR